MISRGINEYIVYILKHSLLVITLNHHEIKNKTIINCINIIRIKIFRFCALLFKDFRIPVVPERYYIHNLLFTLYTFRYAN